MFANFVARYDRFYAFELALLIARRLGLHIERIEVRRATLEMHEDARLGCRFNRVRLDQPKVVRQCQTDTAKYPRLEDMTTGKSFGIMHVSDL